MKNDNENFYLTKTSVKKLLLKFSIPCILGMLVSALYNIVDQIFIGNSASGTAGIMATTLVFPFTVIAMAIALMIGDGCATLFSISLGAKDSKTSQKSIGNTFILILISSLVLTVLGFLFKDNILSLLGTNGYSLECQKYALSYLTIILIGLPFYMIQLTLSTLIRVDGSPLYSMVSTLIGAVINLIFDPIFIFLFDMGVTGAALATILGQFASAVVSLIYFRKPKLIEFYKDCFHLDKKVIEKILKLGISSFITQISIAVITVVANNVVGFIGGVHATDAGGALGIVFKVFAIVIAFSVGVAVGSQPIIGYNYGAQKYHRVLETYRLMIVVNIIIGIIATILFEIFPGAIVSLFGGHANDLVFYQDYAALAFRIYLGGILLCCLQKASCIFLQSIDKPYKAMILSLTRDVILLVPLVCLFGLLGNLYTMLYAGLLADLGSFIITIIFITIEYKKMYKLIKKSKNSKNEDKVSTSNLVITIGREFGSGGKYIGECLAKRLNIPCYDKELLENVAKNYEIDMKTLEKVDEKQKSSFWYSYLSNNNFSKETFIGNPVDNLFLKQAKTIEELALKENCVIIGRCSDYILKNKVKTFNIFIYSSDLNFSIERKKELEHLSKKQAIDKINKINEERSNYYHHYTGQIWGSKENYDICLDTSKLGIEETINLLEFYLKEKVNRTK